ncbi:MAG TPA: hypothetical protein VI504_14170 [Candidatus Eisenbacteria bacterium]|jgi:hypothetical protein
MEARRSRAAKSTARVLRAATALLAATAALAPTLACAGEVAFGVPVDSLAAQAPATSGAPGGHAELGTPQTPPLVRHMARLTGRPRTVLRMGPSESDAIAGVYPPGGTFPVLARIGDWIDLRLSPTTSGWVHSSLCEAVADVPRARLDADPRPRPRGGAYALEGYAGGYAFDGGSSSLAFGGRLARRCFDSLQLEAGAAWTHARGPAELVQSPLGPSIAANEFRLLFYQLNATWEFLPGREVVPFATVGAGASLLGGRRESSFNVGAGTALYLTPRAGMRWQARDYVFHSGAGSTRRLHHNIELSVGSLMRF